MQAEAVLASAVAPAHGPQRWAAEEPRWAALSEWVRWRGTLRPELVWGLLWPPYRKGRDGLARWRWLSRRLSSFLHNGGLGSFERGCSPSCESLGCLAICFGREPLRSPARERIDRACWSRRRTRTADTALVEGEGWRRPSCAPVWRSRHWQVAPHCSAYRTPSGRAAYSPALLLFAATHRQRTLSNHRTWNEQPDWLTAMPHK